MPRWLRAIVLLVAGVTLIGVATPPVIEEHLEPGFCSADCPVQHPGHGAAVAAPPPPSAAGRAAVVGAASTCGTVVELGSVDSPAAPRAPPSA
jgi:hypothetical protein